MIISLIIVGVSFIIGSYLFNGVAIKSVPKAFLAAIVVAEIDATLGPY